MMQNTSSAVMAQRVEPKDSLDLFPTPPWATRALCEWIGCNVTSLHMQSVWEPACGYGDMVLALREYFLESFASDVYPHGKIPSFDFIHDFLMPGESPIECDWIITNPPFRLAAQFVQRALQIAKIGVAMLVRTAFLEGGERYLTLFKPYPPTRVLQFTERVPMHRGKLTATGSTATAYCWIVWQIGVGGDPSFHWIPPCRKRLEQSTDYARVQ